MLLTLEVVKAEDQLLLKSKRGTMITMDRYDGLIGSAQLKALYVNHPELRSAPPFSWN